jgi:hypothetical protein
VDFQTLKKKRNWKKFLETAFNQNFLLPLTVQKNGLKVFLFLFLFFYGIGV